MSIEDAHRQVLFDTSIVELNIDTVSSEIQSLPSNKILFNQETVNINSFQVAYNRF